MAVNFQLSPLLTSICNHVKFVFTVVTTHPPINTITVVLTHPSTHIDTLVNAVIVIKLHENKKTWRTDIKLS